jgi:hypothetical protein
VPFVFGQAWVVIGVNDSVLVLREGDPSEGVAEAQAPVAQSEPDGNACQPGWDSDSDHQSQDAFSGGGALRRLHNGANLRELGEIWPFLRSIS